MMKRVLRYFKENTDITNGFAVIFTTLFMFCVFAPMDIYYSNISEFPFGVKEILLTAIGVMLASFVVIGTIYLIICRFSKKAGRVSIFICFSFFVISYIQGNFLASGLSMLNGSELNNGGGLAKDRWKYIVLCIIVLAVIGLINLILKKKIYKFYRIVSQIFLLVFIATIFLERIVMTISETKNAFATTDGIMEMSTDKNFVILVVDAMDAESLRQILNDSEEYQDDFMDFTFYPNTVAAYSYTMYAIPFILSGQWHVPGNNYSTYSLNSYKYSPLLQSLEDRGYNIGMYESEIPINYDEAENRFFNVYEASKSSDYLKNLIGIESRLVGYKYGTYDLKKLFLGNGINFDTLKDTVGSSEVFKFYQSNQMFYSSICNEDISFTDEKSFKFIHIQGSHAPYELDRNLNSVHSSSYPESIEASIKIVSSYIEKLKENGVYDNTSIMIISDHGGDYDGTEREKNPILFVKGFNEEHDFIQSEAPISQEDFITAYDRLLDGATGEDVFDYKEGDERERRYSMLVGGIAQDCVQTGYASDNSTLYKDGDKYTLSPNESGLDGINLNYPLEWLMDKCIYICNNLGLAILLFTLLSKIILLPVSIWIHRNSIKMVSMQPDIFEYKIKYYGDSETINEKERELYKKKKYSPMYSVVPLFVQLILLLGVIAAIKECLLNPNLDMKMFGINLGVVPADSVGVYILSPALAALSSWIMSYTQNKSNVLQSEQSTVNKYGTMIISVGLSLYLGWFVCLGVALYWIVSNLLSVVQMFLLNWCIKPSKYVDFDRLNSSRQRLEELNSIGQNEDKSDLRRNKKRENADYKRFFSIGNKHLVFYSEGGGFYKYYRGMIEYLQNHTNLVIHYITSDPDDRVFEMDNIKTYYIGERKLITLMMKMDADVVVMTMPDLENYHIKRSYVKDDVEYIYIPHGLDSLNMAMRIGSMDHYDTVFCTGQHQKEEIEKNEIVYNSKPKKLVDWGYSLLDEMIEKIQEDSNNKGHNILIAPSWQEDNIIDSCIDEVISQLTGKGYSITLRPHPQHVRIHKTKLEELKTKLEKNEDVTVELDFSSDKTVMEADILITDWSGIAYEYTYSTKNPVVFINTPIKIMNPEYTKIDTVPINIKIRDSIGGSVDVDKLDTLGFVVANVFENREAFTEQIERFAEENVYNIGTSSEVGARYIFNTVLKHINGKKKGEESIEKTNKKSNSSKK